jgi:hypothetical protein
MPGPVVDESTADDGSIHDFFAWFVAHRRPEADLDDLDLLRADIEDFNESRGLS